MALQLRQTLALCWVPQDDFLPATRKNLAVVRPGDCLDPIAAIFSNIRERMYVKVDYASPPLSGGGVEPTHAKLATFRTMLSPVALERVQALAC